MSSKKLEDTGIEGVTVELLLPIDIWWDVDRLLKEMDYLTSANEDAVLIREVYQKILKMAAKYAVNEKDRTLLLEKVHGGSV